MTDESSETHPEPVVVAAYPDRGEAEVTVAHLLANGIEAFIVDQVEGGTVPIDDEIVAVSSGGVMIRMAVREISSQGRAATGVRVMNLDDGQTVASVAAILASDDD